MIEIINNINIHLDEGTLSKLIHGKVYEVGDYGNGNFKVEGVAVSLKVYIYAGEKPYAALTDENDHNVYIENYKDDYYKSSFYKARKVYLEMENAEKACATAIEKYKKDTATKEVKLAKVDAEIAEAQKVLDGLKKKKERLQ